MSEREAIFKCFPFCLQEIVECSIMNNNAQLCVKIKNRGRIMSRSELREHIFRMLFRIEFNNEEEMKEQEDLYFELLGEISEENKNYIIAGIVTVFVAVVIIIWYNKKKKSKKVEEVIEEPKKGKKKK